LPFIFENLLELLGLSIKIFGKMSKRNNLSGQLADCHKAIVKLMQNPAAWPFLEPVDPIKLGIPTYFDVIKEPMDLRTIRIKLEGEEYRSHEEVNDDVELVWRNARTFNPPNHEVVKCAEILAKLWKRNYSKIAGSGGGSRTKSGKTKAPKTEEIAEKPIKSRGVVKTIADIKSSMNGVKDEIARYGQTGTKRGASPSPTHSSKKQKIATPMTYDEKTQLSNNIGSLESDQLDELLKIIQKAMPTLENSADNTIEIELDKLDDATLRACEEYVNSCLSGNKGGAASETVKVEATDSNDKKQPSNFEGLGADELRSQLEKLQHDNAQLKSENEQLKKDLEDQKKQTHVFKKKIEMMEKALKD
jgi:hypothetical protein